MRQEFSLTTPRILKSDLRVIYRAYGIHIDLWPPKDVIHPQKFRKLRGAYFFDEMGPSVMVDRYLPESPFVFTLAHELKHHLKDQGIPVACSDPANNCEPIEIGAEVFAAELIYPEIDFAQDLISLGISYGQCTPEGIVELKHQTRTTLSYTGMAKQAARLGFAARGILVNPNIHWKKLEEQRYGVPFYKYRQRHR